MSHYPRQFYKVFKPFLGSKASAVYVSMTILESDGREIKDQTAAAECFAKYFTDIAQGKCDPELL